MRYGHHLSDQEESSIHILSVQSFFKEIGPHSQFYDTIIGGQNMESSHSWTQSAFKASYR